MSTSDHPQGHADHGSHDHSSHAPHEHADQGSHEIGQETHDQVGRGTADRLDVEGEYQDKDVATPRADPPVGEYEDRDVPGPQPTAPEDEGSFADTDVVSEHRHPVAEGSFEDAEIPGVVEDVEAVQVERARQHRGDVDLDVTDGPTSTH
jgi:hypothetical protein